MKRNKTQKWKRRNQLENPRKEKNDGEVMLEKPSNLMITRNLAIQNLRKLDSR